MIIILSLALLTLFLLITDVIFIFKIKKAKKIRKQCSHLIELDQAIIPFIIRAEGFKNFTGEEKKKYVISLARQYAQQNNIKTDYSTISDRIDYFVEFCKQVNVRPKKRKCDCTCK